MDPTNLLLWLIIAVVFGRLAGQAAFLLVEQLRRRRR